MKPATSWTRKETFGHCPKRFHFRYLAPATGEIGGLRQLMAVRELGGHVIHAVLADTVRRIALGQRLSDQTDVADRAISSFNSVVKRSLALKPGEFIEGFQLAEVFNGVDCVEAIRDWNEIIPVVMANGIRMMHYFRFKAQCDHYRIEAEQRRTYRHRGRDHQFVVDVIIEDEKGNVTVIDWKTHSIREKDREQVRTYQRDLLHSRQISPTRLYGFAVDLLQGREERCDYRPIDEAYDQAQPSKLNQSKEELIPPSLRSNPYPTRPSKQSCAICPFASICPDSMLATINEIGK